MTESTVSELRIEHIKEVIRQLKEDDIKPIKKDIKELKLWVELYYLTVKQYETDMAPIRKIVYGMVGIVLTSVLAALIFMVIKGGS